MGLTKYEQETIINFNEKEKLASVYTHNLGLQNTLLSLCESHPGVQTPRRQAATVTAA